MNSPAAWFAWRYRAALLDFLLGGGEQSLARAYELGRKAIESKFALLQIVESHHQAMMTITTSARGLQENLERVTASQTFLLEALSSFDMISRGYVHLVPHIDGRPPASSPAPDFTRDSTAKD